MPDIITVNCPICDKPVCWSEQNPFRPFCSKRCQIIDLGEWAAEKRQISASDDLTDGEEQH